MIPRHDGKRDDLDTWPGGYGGSDTSLYKKLKRMKPAPYRFDKDDELRTPPPFVRCGCVNGYVHNKNVMSKNWRTECHKCKDSPLPGWIPQYYTPEQYRDWIRRENNLPDYELPPDTKIYVRSKEGARSWYLTGTMWEYTDGNRFNPRYYWVVIDTIAGRPPKDWKPVYPKGREYEQ